MSSRYLQSIPPYVFWELDARRAAHRANGRSLIDLGIGSPDQAIPQVVTDAMLRAVGDRSLSRYPDFHGHPSFVNAASQYMLERFGVSVHPKREMMALAGAKEGLAELVLSHCNPGDCVLVPEIHYPVYERAPRLAGATPVFVPIRADGTLDLDRIDADDLTRARILIVNYPCNPTTASVPLAEFARLVAFAEQHGLLLVSDLAYSELSYDGFRVPSVLEVPGAMRVAVELHTCSKSFNMAGLRIAFIAGRADAIATLDAYRANIGYGVSTLSQLAGAAAFANHATIVPPVVAEYKRRRDAIVAAFNDSGWNVTAPNSTMYLWLPVPTGYEDWEWVDALMQGPGIVVTPGLAFGAAGRGHFRVSFVQPAEVLARAARSIAELALAEATDSAPALVPHHAQAS